MKQETWIDCKSLDDMLHKTGGTASEKRVALDVHDVQQYIGSDCDTEADVLKWIPTAWMLADPLTKPMPASKWTALGDFLATGCWKLGALAGKVADLILEFWLPSGLGQPCRLGPAVRRLLLKSAR